MRIRFGTDFRRVLTGADLVIRIIQAGALLLVPYVFIASGHIAVLLKPGVFSVLFDMGIAALPRLLTLGLSLLYVRTGHEVAFLFIALAFALILGIIGNRVFRESTDHAVRWRKILLALIIIDTVICLIPMHFNAVFGLPQAAFGIILRAAFIMMILLDLKNAQTDKGENDK